MSIEGGCSPFIGDKIANQMTISLSVAQLMGVDGNYVVYKGCGAVTSNGRQRKDAKIADRRTLTKLPIGSAAPSDGMEEKKMEKREEKEEEKEEEGTKREESVSYHSYRHDFIQAASQASLSMRVDVPITELGDDVVADGDQNDSSADPATVAAQKAYLILSDRVADGVATGAFQTTLQETATALSVQEELSSGIALSVGPGVLEIQYPPTLAPTFGPPTSAESFVGTFLPVILGVVGGMVLMVLLGAVYLYCYLGRAAYGTKRVEAGEGDSVRLDPRVHPMEIYRAVDEEYMGGTRGGVGVETYDRSAMLPFSPLEKGGGGGFTSPSEAHIRQTAYTAGLPFSPFSPKGGTSTLGTPPLIRPLRTSHSSSLQTTTQGATALGTVKMTSYVTQRLAPSPSRPNTASFGSGRLSQSGRMISSDIFGETAPPPPYSTPPRSGGGSGGGGGREIQSLSSTFRGSAEPSMDVVLRPYDGDDPSPASPPSPTQRLQQAFSTGDLAELRRAMADARTRTAER